MLFVQNRVCTRTWRAAKVLSDAGAPPLLLELGDPAPNLDYGVFSKRITVPVERDLRSMVQGRNQIITALKKTVQDEQVDVVHTHNGPDNLGAWAARVLKVPVVHDIHDLQTGAPIQFSHPLLRPAIAWLYGRWEKIACTRAAAVFVPSDELKGHLEERYGVDRIQVVENKALPVQYAPLPKVSATEGGTHLVYAGSLSTAPGSPREFLPGFDRAAQGEVHIHVYPMVFDDAERQKVQAAIAENPNLHYHDPVPHHDLVRTLSQYDHGIVHFPVMTENIKMASATKLYEYILAGIPVVANPEGRIGAFVKEAGCGVTVERLEDAIPALRRMHDLKLPRERCVLDADEFLDVYRSVLGRLV